MKQNIKQNHTKGIDVKLYNANYFDFMLYKGNSKSMVKNKCIANFSNLNIENGILYSETTWDEAINKGLELNNIGLTGVDNGLISYRKDRITNEKFLDLYFNSKLEIEPNDMRLFLTPVTGNTLMYNYHMSLVEDQEKYIAFKGGFYQGFFKSGKDYQVLPHEMKSDWILHFNIRPRTD